MNFYIREDNKLKDKKIHFNIVFTVLVSYILIKFIDSYQYFFDTLGLLLSLLTPFIIAMILAYALNPVIKLLETKFRFKRGQSLLLTYGVLIISLVSALVYTVPILADSITDLISNIPRFVEQTQDFLIYLGSQLKSINPEDLKNIGDKIMQALPNISSFFAGYLGDVFNTTFSIGKFIVQVVLAFVICFYILLEKESFSDFLKKATFVLFGKRYATFTLDVVSILNQSIGKYFSGKILDSAIVGLLSAIGLFFVGSQYALLFGILMGVMNMIPYFGPVIGMTPVVIINLFYDPSIALFSLAFLLLVQQIEVAIIEPKIVGEQLGLSAFLTILAVTIGGGFFGIPGMILSVPIMAVIKIYVDKYIEFKYNDIE